MRCTLALTLLIAAAAAPMPAVAAQSELRTMTGWLSDAQCAAPRVAKGIIAPNNTDCVKRCLDEGHTPVFISEQAKAMFELKDYTNLKADVGYHLELKGTIDKENKTLTVTSVKRLEYIGNVCAGPATRRNKH
jgi:hypothetical protein